MCERPHILSPTCEVLHLLYRPRGDPETREVRTLRCATRWIHTEEVVSEADSSPAASLRGYIQTSRLLPCQRCPYCGCAGFQPEPRHKPERLYSPIMLASLFNDPNTATGLPKSQFVEQATRPLIDQAFPNQRSKRPGTQQTVHSNRITVQHETLSGRNGKAKD